MSEVEQIATVIATLLGALLAVSFVLITAAKKTPAPLATITALVVFVVSFMLTSESLPAVGWAHDLLLYFLFACAIIFGMQWQKKKG